MVNSILLDLRNDIIDKKISVVQLLRKTLLIAQKLKLNELEKWINNELNGYKSMDEVPKYREVEGQVKVWNHHSGILMPVTFHSAEENKLHCTRKLVQSITELELFQQKKEDNKLQIPFPDDLARDLVKIYNWSSSPVLLIENTAVYGIIDSVRDILLKWTFDLEQRGTEEKGLQLTKDEKEIVSDTESITIKSVQNIFGDIKKSNISLNNRINIIAGDFESFKKYLIEELKISKADLSGLEQAIEDDQKLLQLEKIGKNVSAWIDNIVTRTETGRNQLSTNTAGSLLKKAISKYYGF